MGQDISIKAYWTNNIDEKAISDFIWIHNNVFKSNFNECKFNRKYKKNIYGPSIVVLAYINKRCVGARAFWRNDIGNLKAYQPCDTGVLAPYRGLGIFTKMTFKAIDVVGKNVLIYNFPNNHSYPGYLKMGWELKDIKRYKVYNPLQDYIEIDKLPDDYLTWLVEDFEQGFNTTT